MQTLSTLSRRTGSVTLLALASSLGACAEDLTTDTTVVENAQVITSLTDAGEFTTTVDASNAEAWVYFSFESGSEVTPPDPSNSPEWDLGFQRFHIISNGGVSGGGGRAIAVLAGQPFESITSSPPDGYLEDQPDSDDDDTVVDSAFAEGEGWYDYDGATNRLSPRAAVYVIRSAEESGEVSHYKLEILDYYDTAGTSGHPSFAWAPL